MQEEYSNKIAQVFGFSEIEKDDIIETTVVEEKEIDKFLNWEGSTYSLKEDKTEEELKLYNAQLEEQLETLSIKRTNIYKDDVLTTKASVFTTDGVFFYVMLAPNPITNDSYIIVEGPFNPHEAGLKYNMRLNEFIPDGCKFEELKDFSDMTIIEDEEE